MTKTEILDLKSPLEIADRFNLSNTVAAHIMNANSVKTGSINQNDTSEVMYQTNEGRLRKKLRLEKVEEVKGLKPLVIGFDERKDLTKVVDGVGEQGNKRFSLKRVENCSVIFWPEDGEGDKYVGHVVPERGTGKGEALSIFQFLRKRNTNMESLRVLLGDGTSEVIGWKTGAMAELEELMERPCTNADKPPTIVRCL